MRFVYGILAIAIGTILLKYNFRLVNYTGRQDWIESKLGSGSTYLAYKLFAVIIVVGGILAITGLGAGLLRWALSPFHQFFNLSS